ncbi:MAG: glutathione peroxidase [Planctomycetota bacterium]|jgi:glutathione peroxidase
MRKAVVILVLVVTALGCVSCEQKEPTAEEQAEVAVPALPAKPLYGFALNDIDGNPATLGQFSGKALLLVNVASKCGYTKQYAGLQALYEKYQGDGLVVLGFPANNFGAQEPGSNEEIKAFCSSTYNVTFPMSAKISVKGDDIHPLYAFLTGAETNPDLAGDIKWNFNKFLVDRSGDVVGRYDSNVEPMSAELVADIEKVLAKAAS